MATPLTGTSWVPLEDQPFHVEQHGIDYIPERERWATARNIAAMWGGVSINIQYFIYGALLIGFGFNFPATLSLILIGNLSYFLLGLASLQGPETGTTAFMITRAPFGVRGSRIMSFFNWITQLGFETEGLILIVGGAVVLTQMAGFHPSNTVKVIYILVATAIMVVLPYLGHATMVKVLRALIVPFAIAYTLLAIFMHGHLNLAIAKSPYANWELYTAGLAFTFALSGLGWSECGNDYTRYVPRQAKGRSLVGWIFVGTALPQIVMMVLGAAAFTAFGSATVWNGANPFAAFMTFGAGSQHIIPSWFVVIFIALAIVQLFGINALDLYSSGVSLQALGLKLKRYQAVLLDGAIACLLTIWATFGSTFSLYMKEFVGVIIVWIAPWLGIFLVDWMLRKFRYDATALQDNGRDGLYFGHGGFNWNAISAFAIGMVLSLISFSKAPPPVSFPFHWMTPVSNHWGASYVAGLGYFGGADFSVPVGIIGAGLLYFILEWCNGYVAEQNGNVRSSGVLDVARVVASGWATVLGGALIVVAGVLSSNLFTSRAIANPVVAILTAIVGTLVVTTGVSTITARTDKYRDMSMGLALLAITWAVFVYGFTNQDASTGFSGGAWLIAAGGVVALVSRVFHPRGAQLVK